MIPDITFFDCLHDMGDPEGAARHARNALADDGTVLLVEPFAHDRVENNLNPVGRLYYAASTTLCLAHSLSEGGGRDPREPHANDAAHAQGATRGTVAPGLHGRQWDSPGRRSGVSSGRGFFCRGAALPAASPK